MDAVTDTPRESTELAVMKVLTPAVVFAPGGVDTILNKIETEVRTFKPDISTPVGRQAVASLAYKVARSKTALDEMGKTLVSEWKAKANAVDAERRTIRERLDNLKDEVRKPLTDWENADKARIEAHEKALDEIAALLIFDAPPTAAAIKERIDAFEARPVRQWEEFLQRATETSNTVGRKLQEMYAAGVKREEEIAELERLRREKEERERREREEKIAAEAADRARRETEEKAAREAKEAADRASAEQRRVEQEREAAEARAAKAEADRKAAEERAAREKAEAVEAERRRAAAAKLAEEEAARKREANTKHKAKINGAARDALATHADGGLTLEQATSIVVAIATGKIPHVTISY